MSKQGFSRTCLLNLRSFKQNTAKGNLRTRSVVPRNYSISQCMAKTMEHLSDFPFVSMYNFTLVRRDSYPAHVKAGIKEDTLAALREAPMDLDTLFPDTDLKKAEDDISKFEDRGHSHTSSANHKDNRFHP